MVHSAFRENDKYEYSRKSDLYLSNNRIYETYFIHTSGRYEGDTKVHVIGFQIKPSLSAHICHVKYMTGSLSAAVGITGSQIQEKVNNYSSQMSAVRQ